MNNPPAPTFSFTSDGGLPFGFTFPDASHPRLPVSFLEGAGPPAWQEVFLSHSVSIVDGKRAVVSAQVSSEIASTRAELLNAASSGDEAKLRNLLAAADAAERKALANAVASMDVRLSPQCGRS